jgi:hypothetical protein
MRLSDKVAAGDRYGARRAANPPPPATVGQFTVKLQVAFRVVLS